jgi:hypothetical protein
VWFVAYIAALDLARTRKVAVDPGRRSPESNPRLGRHARLCLHCGPILCVRCAHDRLRERCHSDEVRRPRRLRASPPVSLAQVPGELQAGSVDGRDRGNRKVQIIELRLMRATDMFEMPQADLFSEHRNFLTGIDFCISELRSRRSRRPVRLEIGLPAEEIDDDVGERLSRTLRRYCKHRIRYNRRETRAIRIDGVSAFRIGVPVSALGFVMVGAATHIRPSGGAVNLITDHLGWVLMWVGLWFPLDELLFYPLGYGREDRVLRLLSEAEVVVAPHEPVLAVRGTERWR